MLNPLLLWFLPLALLPVLLHLITRRRLQTVDLSTFRFLMDSYTHQRRRFRVLEWIVMALRVGFILLLVLVLARPVVQGAGFLARGEGGRDVTLIFDAGPTMRLESDGTSSLHRAIGAAEQILDRLADGDHVRIIRAGVEPTLLAEGYARRREALADALRAIDPEARTVDLAGAIDRALDGSARGVRTIYIITDGMARSWRPASGRSRSLARARLQQPVTVLDIGPDAPPANIALVGEPPDALRAVRGLPVLLEATVANQSDEPATTTVSIVLDDERLAHANLQLAPRERKTHRFHVRPPEAGSVQGRFEVNPSALRADDVYRFTLDVKPQIGVRIVADTDAHAARPQRERPAVYLQAALAAADTGDTDHTPLDDATRQLAEAMNVEIVHPDRLHQDDHLAVADVLVLADVPMNDFRGNHLRRYVERGGGLIVFPGPSTDAEAYNRHLLLRGQRGNEGAIRLREAVGDVDDAEVAQRIEHVDRAHPVLRAFDEPHYFSTVRVSRRMLIEPAGGHAGALLTLDDDEPVLVETGWGRGRVLLAGVPASPAWSDLVLKPEFVPMLLRGVAHVQRSAEVVAPAVVEPGEPATIHVTPRWRDARVTAITPEGAEHTVDLHDERDRRIGALLETHRPGYYRFEVVPGTDGAPERVEVGFAVNPEADEAGLHRATDADFRAALSPAEFVILRTTPDDPLLGEALDARREIWGTLIWLTLGVIGLEFLLATLRPPATAAERAAAPPKAWRRWADRLRDALNPLDSRRSAPEA